MINIHDQLIRERKKKLAKLMFAIEKLQTQVEQAKIEIQVLQQARSLSQGEALAQFAPSSRRRRLIVGIWADVMKHIGSQHKMSLDEIQSYAVCLGKPIQRATLRAQMASYVNREWLARIEDGVFRLTELGAVKFGYVQKNEVPRGTSYKGEDLDLTFSQSDGRTS